MNADGTPPDHRMLAIGLAVLAAVCLLFAAVSKHWVGRPAHPYMFGGQDIGFGPSGCDSCGGFLLERKGSMTNGTFVSLLREELAETGGFGGARYADKSITHDKLASSTFAPMGWATLALAIIAAISLLVTAFLAYKKQRKELPVSPASIALLSTMLAMVTGMVFVATKPLGPLGVGIQHGFWIYGVGLVVGIVAAQMLGKLIRPVDREMEALQAQLQANGY